MLEELEGDFLEVFRYREYFHRIILIRKCCCGANCDSHMAWGGLNLKLHFVHVPMKELDIKTSPWSVEIWNSPWLVGWSVGGSEILSRKIMNMTSRTVLRRMVHSSLMRCFMVEKNHHKLAAQFQVIERTEGFRTGAYNTCIEHRHALARQLCSGIVSAIEPWEVESSKVLCWKIGFMSWFVSLKFWIFCSQSTRLESDPTAFDGGFRVSEWHDQKSPDEVV